MQYSRDSTVSSLQLDQSVALLHCVSENQALGEFSETRISSYSRGGSYKVGYCLYVVF